MPFDLPRHLASRLPFYYGWAVLAALCLAGLARQGPAVAVLSVFVTPMSAEFGWSRTAMSGAVSLGGVLAALIAPWIGPMLDRHGARATLVLALLAIGLCCLGLSQVGTLAGFYLLFCTARTVWAGPFDLGLYTALNNWFVARRGVANAILSLAQMGGLVALPLLAQLAMADGDWRSGWLAVGAAVLLLGPLPVFLLLARRPEDLGLAADRSTGSGSGGAVEPQFDRRGALATRAFWLLALFTVLVYPVQAGVSLHQAPHLLERGLAPLQAAGAVAVFSGCSALGAFILALLPRGRWLRCSLAGSALALALGSAAMTTITGPTEAWAAAASFGIGIGGVIALLPIAWADYFGRRSTGAIRGVVLSLQVTAQAIGPLLSGLLRDLSGDYHLSLLLFAGLAAAAVLVALLARPPPLPAAAPQ